MENNHFITKLCVVEAIQFSSEDSIEKIEQFLPDIEHIGTFNEETKELNILTCNGWNILWFGDYIVKINDLTSIHIFAYPEYIFQMLFKRMDDPPVTC